MNFRALHTSISCINFEIQSSQWDDCVHTSGESVGCPQLIQVLSGTTGPPNIFAYDAFVFGLFCACGSAFEVVICACRFCLRASLSIQLLAQLPIVLAELVLGLPLRHFPLVRSDALLFQLLVSLPHPSKLFRLATLVVASTRPSSCTTQHRK